MIHRFFVLACLGAIPLLGIADEAGDELLAAARKGDVAAVKALIDKGVDVNSKSPYGSTALFFAADRGHTEVARVLLEHGANPNVKDTFYNATALTWAASKDRVEIVKMLLAKGADGVDMVLSSAVQSGNKELIKTAVDTGKVKQSTLNYGLSMATKAKKDDIAEILKKAGATAPVAATAQIPAETLALYTGKYQGGRGGTEMEIVASVKDGKLMLTASGGPLTFNPLSNTRFRSVEVEQLEVEFKMKDGKVTGFDMIQGGEPRPFTRMEAK